MDEFSEIITLLQKPSSILFIYLDTDESYLHNQSEGEIVIPPIGSIIYVSRSGKSYKVESITFDYQDLIIRLIQE